MTNIHHGFSISESVPLEAGGRFLLGLIILVLGILLDGLGHTLWGFELDLQSILSITHLMIDLGLLILFSNFFWAYSQKNEFADISWKSFIVVFSLILTITLLGMTFHFANSAENVVGWQTLEGAVSHVEHGDDQVKVFSVTTDAQIHQAEVISFEPGIMSALFDSLFLVGMVAVIAIQYQLPIGAWTIIFALHGLPAFLTSRPIMILPMILLGIIVEFVLLRRFPIYKLQTPHNLIIVSTLIPLLLMGLYEGMLIILGINFWAFYSFLGLPALCAAVGWLLSKGFIHFYEMAKGK